MINNIFLILIMKAIYEWNIYSSPANFNYWWNFSSMALEKKLNVKLQLLVNGQLIWIYDFFYFFGIKLLISIIFYWFFCYISNFKVLKFKVLDSNLLSCKDKVMNQKYFYCFEANVKDYMSLETKKIVNISDTEQNMLNLYLEKRNISMEYFLNFKGYLRFYKIETYNKFTDKYNKEGLIYFYNDIWFKEKKDYFFSLNNINDICNIDLILNKYLKKIKLEFIIKNNEIELQIKNFFFSENKDFSYSSISIGFVNVSSYIRLLQYMSDLQEFFNENSLIAKDFGNSDKHYVALKLKDNINYEEIEKDFGILYKDEKEKFENFKGVIYLYEVTLILTENMKLKRLVIFFFNIITNKIIIHFLYDNIDFFYNINLLEIFFDEDNSINNNYSYKNEVENIINNENYEFESKTIEIEKNSAKIIKLKNLKQLTYFLQHYGIFIYN